MVYRATRRDLRCAEDEVVVAERDAVAGCGRVHHCALSARRYASITCVVSRSPFLCGFSCEYLFNGVYDGTCTRSHKERVSTPSTSVDCGQERRSEGTWNRLPVVN